MSQKGPAPRPASRRSSQSSARDAASSPSSQRNPARQDDPRAQPLHDPGGFSVADSEGRSQQTGSRASGVRDILNPTNPQAPSHGLSPPLSRRSFDAGTSQQAMGAGAGAGQYGGGSPSRPFALQGQAPVPPEPGAQVISTTISVPPPQTHSLDRGSPSGSHPYPLAAARRMLTPKSPRAISLSRAASRSMDAQHLPGLPLPPPPPHAPRGTAPAHETSPLSGPPTLGGPTQYSAPSHGQESSRPRSALSRSLSQPVLTHGLPSASPKESLKPSKLGRDLGGRTAYSSGSPFATPVPSTRGHGVSGPLGESRWGSGLLGSIPPGPSGSRGLQMTEGHQHLLTITPTHGEEIVVPVDVHQASKQADEKRQRNAGASARFRQRKKEKEKEQQQGLQKLESENRDLERRVEELEAEVDFYRNDRNRLRDLVLRTPEIRDQAEGPKSPTPSRRWGSFATENSSRAAPQSPLPHSFPQAQTHAHAQAQAQAQAHTQAQAQAQAHRRPPPATYDEEDDPSMLERPTRRRRTGSESQLAYQGYRPTTPVSLPPLPHTTYGIPSPQIGTSPRSARLPPLRFDQPSETPPADPSGPYRPPLLPQTQSSSQNQPYNTRPPYGAGWATDPRGPSEGGSR
ncbi:hypothetical protein B0T22DRAFT_26902 [Podospora appendiculata]|uniref:BZIP domain-containing protein n=1 Tax=Podospora appendiculata TaxID=314037 RepID=A0AAE1CFM7_9PEZI|nr:hypothetical protein B0T22DRAFT_26902 [Podospora appendiculata]